MLAVQIVVAWPLPPRTRGRPGRLPGHALLGPSTPAHAGPTAADTAVKLVATLYPRARGADMGAGRLDQRPGPLPPRTRGRLSGDYLESGFEPSTPAHAGPTGQPCCSFPVRPLYPRARGADLTMMWMWSPPFPLPPRTRGRLPSDPGGHGGAPSTPAHAGLARA